MTFKVDVGGQFVRVAYLLKVTELATANQSDLVFCRKTGIHWRITSANFAAPRS